MVHEDDRFLMISVKWFGKDQCMGSAAVDGVAGLCRALDSLDASADYVLVSPSATVVPDATVAEMIDIFSLVDRHGVICPREVVAEASASDEAELLTQWGRFSDSMPRYGIEWRPKHACAMLNGKLLRSFGGLDPSYETLVGCLWDFAFRINDFGYSTLIANKACAIAPADSRISDAAPSSMDKKKLEELYPQFFNDGLNYKTEVFGDLVQGEWDSREMPPSILFEFSTMDDFYCGTSEYQVALLRYFSQLYSDKYILRVRCNPAAIEFHNLLQFENVEFYLPDEDVPTSDIGILANQPLLIPPQRFAAEHCARVVYSMLDCILTRSAYLAEGFPERVDLIRFGLRNADGVISISEFSRADYRTFFNNDEKIMALPSCVTYLATDFGAYEVGNAVSDDGAFDIPLEDYSLVIGNAFRHKALQNVIDAVAGTDENYVVIGDGCNAEGIPNVYRIDGMRLEESFLVSLYKKSKCVVFPSQYEGFGLPVTIALKFGKKVVLYNDEVNRELVAHFDEFADSFVFFDEFEEIPGLVQMTSQGEIESATPFTYSWKDAITTIEPFVASLLEMPLDWKHIEERVWSYKMVEGQMEDAARVMHNSIGFKRLLWERFGGGRPKGREIDWIGL